MLVPKKILENNNRHPWKMWDYTFVVLCIASTIVPYKALTCFSRFYDSVAYSYKIKNTRNINWKCDTIIKEFAGCIP